MREALTNRNSNPELIKLLDTVFFYMGHEVCKFWEFDGYLKSNPIRAFQIFEPEGFTDDYLRRSDWYFDHLPPPQEFGFHRANEVMRFGVNALDIMLASDPSSAYDEIEKLHQKLLESAKKKEEEPAITVNVPSNLDCPQGCSFVVTAEELAQYNEYVRLVNETGEVTEKNEQMSETLKQLLTSQGIYPSDLKT